MQCSADNAPDEEHVLQQIINRGNFKGKGIDQIWLSIWANLVRYFAAFIPSKTYFLMGVGGRGAREGWKERERKGKKIQCSDTRQLFLISFPYLFWGRQLFQIQDNYFKVDMLSYWKFDMIMSVVQENFRYFPNLFHGKLCLKSLKVGMYYWKIFKQISYLEREPFPQTSRWNLLYKRITWTVIIQAEM